MGTTVVEINKKQLKEISKNIRRDVKNLGASSIRYWIIRHYTGEAVGSKQAEHKVQDHIIEKVRGYVVKSGKYIFIERQPTRGFDFSIQINPNYRLNMQIKWSNFITGFILAVTCYYIAYPIIFAKRPDAKPNTENTTFKKTKDSSILTKKVVKEGVENDSTLSIHKK